MLGYNLYLIYIYIYIEREREREKKPVYVTDLSLPHSTMQDAPSTKSQNLHPLMIRHGRSTESAKPYKIPVTDPHIRNCSISSSEDYAFLSKRDYFIVYLKLHAPFYQDIIKGE